MGQNISMYRIALLGWLSVGVLGAAYFWLAYPRVFPEASVDLRITPREALQRGEQALRQLQPDLNLADWRHTVQFDWDENAKRYLEKTLGLSQANQVMRDDVSVWYFACRWQREGERMRYWASVAPSGEVVAAGYTLPEEAVGAQLRPEQARAIAERFLQTQLRLDLSQWRLVNTYQQQRPQRRDYVFEYEHQTLRYPADAPNPATVRLRLSVAGDRVNSYTLRWLHTPEKWAFEQRQRESQRRALGVVFGTLYMLLQIGAVGLAIWLVIRRQPLAWGFASRVALLLVVVIVLAQLNAYPLWWARYDPARPEPAFLAGRLIGILFFALFEGFLWFVFALVGEWLSRATPLGNMPFAKLATARFWTTREAVRALFVGLAFAGIHLGYLCAVYLIGFRLGAWSPLAVPYTNGVVLPLPFVEPLLYGLLPAIQEELMFRAIALYVLWRLTRQFWVAALLSSTLWAFLHIGYPTEPVYMRGLELIPVGLAYCWLAARYGILAPITAHYTYNALLTATTYLNMDAPYLRWSALVVALGAFALFTPALLAYLRQRTLPTLDSVEAPTMHAPPPATPAEPQIAPYRPLTRRDWALLAGILGVLVALGIYRRAPEVGEFLRGMHTNRTEALQIAREYLTELGVGLEGYRALAEFFWRDRDDIEEYARAIGQEEAYEQLAKPEPSELGYWRVRFFRPLERTEWYVYVGTDGEVFNRKRVLAEEATGDLPEERAQARVMLTETQARQRAEQYLADAQGYDLSEWRLIETDLTEHPNRTDYVFTYEHRQHRIGEARQRLSVEVQGLLVHDVSEWWEIPEQWYFQQRRVQAWGVFAGLWVILLLLGLVGYVVYVEWREGNASSFSLPLAWRALVAGALCLVLLILSDWEGALWRRYDPADPLATHVGATLILQGLLVLLGGGLVAMLYAGLEPSYWRTRLGHLVPLSVWLTPRRWHEAPPSSPPRHPAAWREGIAIAAVLSLASGTLELFLPRPPRDVSGQHLWLGTVAFAGLLTLIIGALALAAVGTYRRYLRSLWRVGLLALAFAPAAAIGVSSWEQLRNHLLTYVEIWAVVVIVGYLLGRRLLQGNFVAWALLLFWGVLADESAIYLQIPDPALRMQGVIMGAIYLLSVAWAFWWAWRQSARAQMAVVSPAAQEDEAHSCAVVYMETPRAQSEREEA